MAVCDGGFFVQYRKMDLRVIEEWPVSICRVVKSISAADRCFDLTYTSSQECHRDTLFNGLVKKSGMTHHQAIATIREFFASKL
jgi:hypothetical protein